MKNIIIAALIIAIAVSTGTAQAEKVMSAELPGMAEASVSIPEHRLSLFATATNFPKSDSIDKYETSYRAAMEFESDSFKKGDFSLIPGFYYAAVGIDKERREYTINPAVAMSVRYHILGGRAMSVQVGYGTNGGDKSGPIFGGKFNLYRFSNNDVGIEAGVLFSNIGESVNSYMVGVSFPLN